MADDFGIADNTAYSKWKSWGTATPFGQLDRGEADYFNRELRGVTKPGINAADVLEVGFGNGAFLHYCRSLGWNITGTELDPELIAAGIASGFKVHSADDWDNIPEESFDLIAAFDVLEHIPQEEIVEFLTVLSSRLRTGGAIIFRFPNADSWLGNPMQFGDPTHVTQIGYLKMTYFAMQANLEIVKFRGAKRHGFQTSFVHGMYSVLAVPLIGLIARLKRMLYFPGIPVVLSTSNVVCVVRRAGD